MATTFLAATPIQDTFFLPGTNTPGNGVQLFCYAAGSSTKTTVYKDNAGATPHTNPIVLDSGGNIPSGGEVWQTQGQSMKYVYAPSNDTDPPASPYRTLDNMPGTNDVSGQTGVEWLGGPTPTFVSGTQFTLVGDQTATFTKGRRVKTTNTGGTVYSTIVGSSFGANTTVNIVNDSGSLDAGLSAVSYGLFDPANVSISPSEIYRKGANVASGGSGTTDIWGVIGDYVHVTGTNTIQHFSSAPYPGAERTVIFDGVLTLSHNSPTIQLPGSVSVTTAPNDRIIARADSVSTTIITEYSRAALPLYAAQASNTIFAGPASGAASTASFRAPVGADGASLVLIQAQSAASSATIDFATGITNTYDEYLFALSGVRAISDAAVMTVRVSEDGGGTWKAAAADYQYALKFVTTTGAEGLVTTTAANAMTINNNISSSNVHSLNGEVRLYQPSNAAIYKHINTQNSGISGNADGNRPFSYTGMGLYVGTTNAINGVRFLFSAGNIAVGKFAMYGVRNA